MMSITKPVIHLKFLSFLLFGLFFLTGCTSRGFMGFEGPGHLQSNGPVVFSHADSTLKGVQNSADWSPTVWAASAQPVVAASPRTTPLAPVPPVPNLTVYFDNNQDALTPKELDRLRSYVASFDAGISYIFEVAGHTDSNHTPDYNVDLSLRRAEHVKQWMQKLGMRADRIQVVWFGLQKPATENTTDQGRALNRRVEIKVSAR